MLAANNEAAGMQNLTPVGHQYVSRAMRLRRVTPAERIRVKWFCIGVAFSWLVMTVVVLWVDAGGAL